MILSAHLGTGLQDRNKLPKAVPNACFTGDSKLLFLRRGEMRRTTVPRQVNTWDLNIGAVPPSRPGRLKRGGTVLCIAVAREDSKIPFPRWGPFEAVQACRARKKLFT